MTELLIMQQLGILYQCFRKEGTIFILLLQWTRAAFSEACGSSEDIVIWHSISYFWRLFYCKWSISFPRTGDIEVSYLSAIVYKYIFANKSLKLSPNSESQIFMKYRDISLGYSAIALKTHFFYTMREYVKYVKNYLHM